MPTSRCAIYTRKSSEEGLEQGFNSLHAQRESCQAYVLSQAGEGWTASPTLYDDGGFSGGSMERPGLKQLLEDVRRRLVDVIVVYKVDRLTRSLADFARIVELFDTHGVSFVSVTQAFNTTTSMGRLTLNVLLSFAQFEREVTGERIRDKIAASKAKGLWMGGRTPLGYDSVGRKLVVNDAEAATVRSIFARYLELGSVRLLQADLVQRNVVSKRSVTQEGKSLGGTPFSRGALYHLLGNPVYLGAIRHGTRLYDSAHPSIIDLEQWRLVQAKLVANAATLPGTPRLKAPVLLQDLLFDDRGHPMRVLHTKKQGRRYNYYASAALNANKRGTPGSVPRIAVGMLDEFAMEQVPELLSRGWRPDDSPTERVRAALLRVELGEDRVLILLRSDALVAGMMDKSGAHRITDDGVEATFAIRLKHRKGEAQITIPGRTSDPQIDRVLLRAICLTRSWSKTLANGDISNVKELATRFDYWDHYIANLLPLAWLAPDITEAILNGRQRRSLLLSTLLKNPLPMDWTEQRKLFAAIE